MGEAYIPAGGGIIFIKINDEDVRRRDNLLLLNRGLKDKVLLTVSRVFGIKNLEWIPLDKEVF